ncbi:MAG: EAL domain-containing protein [Eubacterium sp.]|nr:EAL domain-containing protein [Eubacterium sp.]
MTNQKIYKKIKKSGVGSTIVLSIIFTILMIVLMIFAAGTFLEYLMDTKFSSEYETIVYLAHLYEEGQKGNYGDVFGLIDEDGHNYIIKDKSGKIIRSKGDNTCSSEGKKAKLNIKYDDVKVYEDTEINYIHVKNDSVSIDLKGLWKWINSEEGYKTSHLDELDDDTKVEVTVQSSDTEIEDSITHELSVNDPNRKYVNVPVWLGVDVNNGTEEFVGQALMSIDTGEIGIIILLVLLFVVIFSLLNLAFILTAIAGLVRQRKIVRFFFADTTTRGRNWMWFHIKGNELLRSRFGRRNKYAVVNLTFVNYRNYCVSHSLAEGEKMLAKVYELINKQLTKKEMCAHVSSSSFALALRYDDESELQQRLENLISMLENVDPGHKFSFQAGVQLVDEQGTDKASIRARKKIEIENEYNNACSARSRISDTDESGIVYFDDKLVEEQVWLDQVQEKQAQAVANEEFLVYYQPKYDPRSDKLCGAEALIRWESPDFGFVTPFRFIPIFEKNGFITEIDHYMITHVARDQKKWLDKGYTCVPVSVNVSRAHFIESDLAEQIRDMVDAEGCPHEYIEIELTESAFFDDKKAMINTINRLKSYGFTVSMDDFGAGYSSLNSLKDMPLDVLKLDADFFRGENENGRGEIVVSEAIKLAKSLNMKTVAEGVETEEQVKFLAGEGCDMIQGYYYAKPMPEAEYEERMR